MGGPGALCGLRAGCPDQPSRPRLCRRAILQHGVGHRPDRQQTARHHSARAAAAGEFQPALHGAAPGARHGILADHRTIAVVAIGSNAVNFIDTATNAVRHVTYVGRSPHEAFFTMDGKEVWVTVRGENYVSVLDGATYEEKSRIIVPNGPGMTIFSPDGKYGY